jgi:TolB-like protein/Tfp pilus assembly protein PilF
LSFFEELKRRNVFRTAIGYIISSWLLVQVADLVLENIGSPDWVIQTIMLVIALGFPVVVFFSWAYEVTPDGIKLESEIDRSESTTHVTGRKLDRAIVAVLVIALAYFAYDKFILDPERDAALVRDLAQTVTAQAPADPQTVAATATGATSIAVLPFADLSPAGDQEYFSDGIAEEILNVLVGVEGLHVTSRTSSFQFKDAGLGIPEIARTLKVQHVVEGSVRKSGKTIRVTAQLIDADNDRHLWSDTFDRPLTAENIFAIQDEIANSIVEALSNTLGVGKLEVSEVVASTHNLPAYELYLQARPLFLARKELDVADTLLGQALQQDPGYAQAWEMRAALQALMVYYGFSQVSIDQAEQAGLEFAERALKIEPRSALALAVIARTRGTAAAELRSKEDFAEIIALFDTALEIDPRNASALLWRGLRYMLVGDLEKALDDFVTCMRYEPYYVPCTENHFAVLAEMGRDEESRDAFIKALNISTTKPRYAHFASLARLGEELVFKALTNDLMLLRGWRRHDELWNAYRNPDQDHGELIDSIRLHMESNGNMNVEDFKFLVQPLRNDWRIPSSLLLWDASVKHYRQSNAFKSYIRESVILEYWQEVGFPSQCRPIGQDDFECD